MPYKPNIVLYLFIAVIIFYTYSFEVRKLRFFSEKLNKFFNLLKVNKLKQEKSIKKQSETNIIEKRWQLRELQKDNRN